MYSINVSLRKCSTGLHMAWSFADRAVGLTTNRHGHCHLQWSGAHGFGLPERNRLGCKRSLPKPPTCVEWAFHGLPSASTAISDAPVFARLPHCAGGFGSDSGACWEHRRWEAHTHAHPRVSSPPCHRLARLQVRRCAAARRPAAAGRRCCARVEAGEKLETAKGSSAGQSGV